MGPEGAATAEIGWESQASIAAEVGNLSETTKDQDQTVDSIVWAKPPSENVVDNSQIEDEEAKEAKRHAKKEKKRKKQEEMETRLAARLREEIRRELESGR